MNKMAAHMRICTASVTDDDVDSRRAAATSLATKWGKDRKPLSIATRAADIANALGGNGEPSSSLGKEVQAAIQKKSSSYLYEERPLDVSVCAGMSMISILDSGSGLSVNGWSNKDIYATALWSALAYQPVLEDKRREDLRSDVLEVAVSWVTKSAEKARERTNVPDPSDLNITISANNTNTSEITAACDFQEATASTVEALRRNAALDREELDFLWWAQLGRSRLLKRQLSAIVEPTRIVSAAIEGAGMLRRLPCEVHRDIVLRTLDEDSKLDLKEMLTALEGDREVLGAPYAEGVVAAYPSVFPFLHALATGETNESGASVKRRVSEWGCRALLEAGFVKLMNQGVSKI